MPIAQILLASGSGAPPTPTYTLTPTANDVNEGSELIFTVGGTNIPNGTYYWTIQTNAGDFTTADGTVTVTSNSGTFGVTPTADTTTEGSETFTVALRSVSITGTILVTSSAVTINDTSLSAPTYTITALGSQASATSVDEGSSATFEVGGTNIIDGTYYWTIETNAEDFATASGSFSITSNTGSFSVVPTEDTTTEGEQTFTVAVRSVSTTGTVLVTSDPFTINDTSLTPPEPTYTLTPEADNVDEGGSLEFTVGGTNIPDGNYSWVIETGAEDFTTTNGSVTVTGNSGTFSVTPTEDTTTEGPGTFTVSLRTGLLEPNLVTSESVTINDTSLDPPEPTYTLTPAANDVDEGSSLEFTVGGTDIPAGNYYWTVETNSSDFGTTSGVFPIGGNSGTFTVTPTADVTTEGSETFTVSVRSGDVEGTVLITSDPITINDTSFPVAPFSLEFVNSEADYVDVAGSSDFNLGTTWTIEFWLKANAKSETASGGIWGLVNQVGWSTTNAIVVALSDNKLVFLSVANEANNDVRYVEPTPGVWTHVAISNNAGTQKVFYNGAEQIRVSGNVGTASYTNSTDPVRIGRLGPTNGGTLNGKMALVRISNTAKYATAFTPVTTYGVETDTKLLLDLDTPLIGLSYYELNGVSLVTNGPTVIYISKSAYPNLNNQVQAGNTVVNTFNQTTSVVTGEVFTADSENWGVNVSPGWGLVATVNFTGTRSASVTNSGTALSNDVPTTFAPLSLQFVQSQTDYLDVAASSDWNNVTANWTIEFWSKASKASTSSDRLTVMCQDWQSGGSFDLVYINQEFYWKQSMFTAEPTPGQWTHVALLCDGASGSLKLYYNGILVEDKGVAVAFGNNSAAIRIGARGPDTFERFDGNLALIRISNTAKYTGAFTPTTTYGVEADTLLFLGKETPLIDSKGHITTNNGVGVSTNVPRVLAGVVHPYNGGSRGTIYCLSTNPKFAEFQTIPIGARITSNIAGFGTRTVDASVEQSAGEWRLGYDPTGLTGVTSNTDTFTFIW